jgi:hypothetical protein
MQTHTLAQACSFRSEEEEQREQRPCCKSKTQYNAHDYHAAGCSLKMQLNNIAPKEV